MEQQPSTLTQARKILADRGLNPIDYKHLPYNDILKLAGLKPGPALKDTEGGRA